MQGCRFVPYTSSETNKATDGTYRWIEILVKPGFGGLDFSGQIYNPVMWCGDHDENMLRPDRKKAKKMGVTVSDLPQQNGALFFHFW